MNEGTAPGGRAALTGTAGLIQGKGTIS